MEYIALGLVSWTSFSVVCLVVFNKKTPVEIKHWDMDRWSMFR